MFDNIIGNNENKNILKNIIKSENISHSYIFSGISGIGKMLFAKEFAKAILCSSSQEKPCYICKSCEGFANGNNPDIFIIDEQENSIKIEQTRELINNILEKPIQGKKKIYIINNSENMTEEAQNSLLKTLEEPPKYVIIILITSNENLLLNTIKSRATKISFNKLSNEEIEEYFSQSLVSVNHNIINFVEGSIEKAINIKENMEIYEKISKTFENIENMNELQILNIRETLFNDKEKVYSVLDYINTIFRNKILKDFKETEKYENCIKIIEETKLRLKRNSNYDMAIDYCLLAIERRLSRNG